MKTYAAVLVISSFSLCCLGACPSADLTGDCFVDLDDLSQLAGQWLTVYGFDDLTAMTSEWLTGDPDPLDQMVYIPAGTFLMGDTLDTGGSGRIVTLSSFFINRYEVTNQQYCDFLNAVMSEGLITVNDFFLVYSAGPGTSYHYCDTWLFNHTSQIFCAFSGIFSIQDKNGRSMANDPMITVTWYGAAAYCNWLSEQEGREPCYDLSTWTCDFSKNGYHLPTEAQWEYAARGGLAQKRFPWGDTICQRQVNYKSTNYYSYDVSEVKDQYHPIWNDSYQPYTSPVGFFNGSLKYKAGYNWPSSLTSYQTISGANGYDLYDMSGNATEWCNDWLGSYNPDPQTDPTGPDTGEYRIFRGGGWLGIVVRERVADRKFAEPAARGKQSGFRIALY